MKLFFHSLVILTFLAYPKVGWSKTTMKWKDYAGSVGISVKKPLFTTTCSGVLLTPNVVLTAAHCVDEFVSAQVTTAARLQDGVLAHEVIRGLIHPGYKGNVVGKSVDIGLFILATPVKTGFEPPILAAVNPKLRFERIGYGIRNGRNVRTWVTSFFQKWFGGHVKTTDVYGMGGDSGGPVFQRHEGGLRLVGVHTGREIRDGKLAKASYIQTLGEAEISWIREQMVKSVL